MTGSNGPVAPLDGTLVLPRLFNLSDKEALVNFHAGLLPSGRELTNRQKVSHAATILVAISDYLNVTFAALKSYALRQLQADNRFRKVRGLCAIRELQHEQDATPRTASKCTTTE